MEEPIKVVCATAIPVGSPAQSQTVENVLNDTVSSMQCVMEDFDDECQVTPKEKKAMDYLNQFNDYIKSGAFTQNIKETAKKYKVPEKELAKNVFEKVLGTVGDILGIAINVICDAGRFVVRIVGTVVNGVIDLIQHIFNGAARIITLNKTCTA